MHSADPIVSTVVLLAAGVIGLTLARFARISPIVGFFVLGAVIGPQALALIDNHSATIHLLGELGVCFLLFDIGLHVSLKELRKGWKKFFLAGMLQFLVAGATLGVLARWFGLSWFSALTMGAVFSLSSTALVLKILSDAREDTSPIGKRATEVLIFQDLTAILLLVVLSGDLSRGVSVSVFIRPVLNMILAGFCVVIIGRLALKPLFRLLIALKSDEVITASALLLVFLASWATQSLGLSLALGAFLGGLALSESSYSYLVRAEVAPFRSLLLALFFLSVGINLNLSEMWANLSMLLSLLLVFSLSKVAANIAAFRIAGIERGLATLLSFLLAQGSEFSFVLLGAALSAGIIDGTLFNLSVLLVGLSLAVTPVLSALGCLFSRSVCKVRSEEDAASHEPREVIIVRIDEFGRQLAGLLEAEGIPYRAHDLDLERLNYAKSRGLNVYYSDLNRPRTLGRVSLGKALAVVSFVEDDRILRTLLQGLRKIDNAVPIVAATDSPARLELLSELGVEQIFIKNDASLVALFEALMRALGFDENRIDEAIERARQRLEPERYFPELEVGASLDAARMAA